MRTHFWRDVQLALFAGSLFMIPAWRPVSAQRPELFAVVVDSGNTLANLSLSELRTLFRGERQFWPDGRRVVLLLPATGTVGRSIVLERIYQLQEGELHRYWIAKTFRDDVAAGPKIVSTPGLALRLVSQIPGAIAIIPLSEVRFPVRVVQVNGRSPGSEQYPLAYVR